MLRRASGPSSSGRYFPHVDFDFQLDTHDLVKPWWLKSPTSSSRGGSRECGGGTFYRTSATVQETLTKAGAFRHGADPHTVTLSAFDSCIQSFDVVSLQTVWVALNESPCYNNQLQLALASWE